MKLDAADVNHGSLAELADDAARLLCREDFDGLASRYGYALCYGREPVTAIRDDLRGCLSEIGATSLVAGPQRLVARVGFFKPNSSNLVAAVEFLVPADNGAAVQVGLIVTTDGTTNYITLEGLAAA